MPVSIDCMSRAFLINVPPLQSPEDVAQTDAILKFGNKKKRFLDPLPIFT